MEIDSKILFQFATNAFERLKFLDEIQTKNEIEKERLQKYKEIYRYVVEKVPFTILKANREIPYLHFFYGITLYYLNKNTQNKEAKENAIRLIKNAIETSPPNAIIEYQKQLLDILINEKKYNDAVILCSQILQFFPTDKFYLKLIIDLLQKINRIVETLFYAKRLVNIDPFDSEAYFIIGKLNFLNKEYDESLKMFQKSKDLDPKNPETYKYIGKLFLLTGKKAIAGSNFKTAVAKKMSNNEQYNKNLKFGDKSTIKLDPKDDDRNTLVFLFEMYIDLVKCGENFNNELSSTEEKLKTKGFLTKEQIELIKKKNKI
ncbi:MAG: hypothetical protein A2086_08555 [Spirochaetes bacterium GWD1_27_9]|nr:MAG: hypothetical protein A2Z98_02330 [Spirochaetes bacterium GWB1_27_13]OHD23320.1 MAG: hypothetical protein A2Y34_11650 [Spirochaetes bacterium GWC1_27_15]OHD44396.1 MAG: hypothetical protein A2086_08555 [Spirochaetes bacterium GWD1_27_9]